MSKHLKEMSEQSHVEMQAEGTASTEALRKFVQGAVRRAVWE